MKKYLLAIPLLASAAFAKDNVMTFIGDSITHGYKTPGYRFEFWKILEDNAIPHRFVGVNSGSTQFARGTSLFYNGKPFNNVHCAGSSWRTYQTSGDFMNNGHQRGVGPNSLPALGYIMNWLDLPDQRSYDKVPGKSLAKGQFFDNGIKTYSGAKLTGNDLPDTFFIMLGTNDLYSDKPGAEDDKKVFGYLKNIISAARQANPKAKFVLLSMPNVTPKKNPKANSISPSYNSYILKNLASLKSSNPESTVTFADINPGISTADNFLADVMADDGLHPNPQGNLIIAGNLARALNLPQRTAGLKPFALASLPAKALVSAKGIALSGAGDFNRQANNLNFDAKTQTITFNSPASTSGSAQSISAPWNGNAASTLTFSVKLAKSGKDNALAARLGNSGLNVFEDRIEWFDGSKSQPVYYTDTTSDFIPLTITLKPASTSIPGGFYVWLGNQLIAEAKPAAELSGSTLSFGQVNTATPCKAQLKAIAGDTGNAFCPPAPIPSPKR